MFVSRRLFTLLGSLLVAGVFAWAAMSAPLLANKGVQGPGYGYGVGKNRLRVYRLARGSAQESLNQLRGLLDDELLPRKEFYALFNLGRTIVKMLSEQIGD